MAPADHQVTVATQPGIFNAWIGNVTNFTEVNDTPVVNSAQLVNALNLAKITGSAHVNVGNMQPENLVFSAADIANHRFKTAVSHDYSQSLVSSLVGDLNLTVNMLVPDLLGLVSNQLKALVRTLLLSVTPALDTIVYTTVTTLGIRLGEADVTVHGVRCNNAVVVQ